MPDYLVTMEVTGRKSGRTVSLPLVVAIIYLRKWQAKQLFIAIASIEKALNKKKGTLHEEFSHEAFRQSQ